MKKNWSGDTVLVTSNPLFPIDRTKTALNTQDFDIWRPGFLGVFHAFRRKLRYIVQHGAFNAFIMLSVFLNTLILASQGLVIDAQMQALLSDFNLLFTIIFTIEMGLKLIGLGVFGIFELKPSV